MGSNYEQRFKIDWVKLEGNHFIVNLSILDQEFSEVEIRQAEFGLPAAGVPKVFPIVFIKSSRMLLKMICVGSLRR